MSALLILQVIRMVGESQEAVGAGVGGGSSGTNKMPTLEEYGTNLTRQAEEVSRGAAAGLWDGAGPLAWCSTLGLLGSWLYEGSRLLMAFTWTFGM
jgi:hypothetical protein